MSVRNLEFLFHPKSIALIGASTRPHSVGAVTADNLRLAGFDGPILPVNPKHAAVAGILAYPNVASLPVAPELAVICTPAKTVPGLIAELGARGTKAAIVISAGFHADGNVLEQQMLAAAKPHLMRIIGPNCLGVLSTAGKLNASFAQAMPKKGGVAFVAQSGAMVTTVLDWAAGRGIGFSHLVSLGDMSDVDFGDMLDYLATDEETTAILLYVEAITHSRKFMSAARAAARLKPVIAIKAGRQPAAAKAAASHTGALAGLDAVYDAAFQRAGIGTSGYAIKNIVPGGLDVEAARGVVIQADGKIVVAGHAEHQVYGAGTDAGALARDADVFVVRFTAQGQLDTTFGTAGVVETPGVVRQDVGTGILTPPTTDGGVPALSGSDSFWSLSLTSDNKLVIHTATRGLGASLDGGVRTDSDFALVRLGPDGALDTTFGASGIVRTDFSNTNASVRSATVLPNGSIVGAGYSNNGVLTGTSTNAQNPILYKVNADGTPDTAFGATDPVNTPGLWHDYARRDMKNAEAYGAAIQGSKFVTLGYGPTPNTTGSGSDLIYFRFNADGSQDRTFGTDGVTFVDVGGLGDNGRCLATLPDNRIIGGGTGRPKPATAPDAGVAVPADAVISVLTENGQPDSTFGANGVRTYDFGGPGDHIWGISVAPNKKQVAAVGIQTGATPTDDDDGAIVILNLP